MKETTKAAISAILTADETVSQVEAKAILESLGGRGNKLGRVIRAKEVARLAEVTTKTVRDWCKAGGLVPVRGPVGNRVLGYTEESVRAILAGKKAVA